MLEQEVCLTTIQDSSISPVAIFLPPSITESFEIVLARACDLNDNGENIVLAFCTGVFRGCVANPYGCNALCSHCASVTEQAIASVLPNISKVYYCRVTVVNNTKNNMPDSVFNGPRSTILTFYRQDVDKINWKYKNALFIGGLFKRFKKYEKSTYYFTKSFIKRVKPKRIEYFNGRITPTMSISQAAIDSGVSHCAIEVSGFNKNFFFAHNTKVHDLSFLKDRMKNYEPGPEAKQMGISFFHKRRGGINTNDKTYTSSQHVGMFGSYNKKLVAIFLSSTDEFQIFGDEWFTNCSRDPASFVLELRSALDSSYDIVLRMHPNQSGDKTGISDHIMKVLSSQEGVQLIKPTDRHSSYELLDIACVAITFGSSIGFEATYSGKPSILAGRCAWESEGVAYVVESAEEAAKIVLSQPQPLDSNKAVKIATYYMDNLDETFNLSYEHERCLYKVRDLNFLPQKRKSFFYKLNRAIDKFLIR